MTKKLLSMQLQGKNNAFTFQFYGDPAYIESWKEEGFDVIEVTHEEPFDIEGLMLADKSLAH